MSNIVTSFLLVVFVLFDTTFAQNHGDSCGAQFPECDDSQWLYCDPVGKCSCQGGGYFDPFQEKCFSPASASCGSIPPVVPPCTPNSECDGTCKCNEGYFPNAGGRCRLPHNSHCELSSDQCDLEGFMQCGFPNQTCECWNKNEAVFDAEEQVCKLLLQASCSIKTDAQKCALHSSCSELTERCECLPQFESNGRRRCFVPHGEECLVSQMHCDQSGFIECIDEKCTCSGLPETVYYNQEDKECQKLVPSACGVLEGSQKCVPHSICDPNARECRCEVDLEPHDGFCFLEHGDLCSSRDDMCNELAYMECSEDFGICGCKFGTETLFDAHAKTCRLRADAACSLVPGSQTCVHGANCVPSEGEVPSRCQCQFNLEANENRECFLPYGKSCDHIDNYCDPAAFLICGRNNTCICPETMWFDGNDCKFFLNGTNNTCNNENEKACPANSFCDQTRCTCKSGFETAENNYECLGTFGTDCDETDTICNEQNNLMCYNNACTCKLGYLPEQELNGLNINCRGGYKLLCNVTNVCSWRAGLRCIAGQCDCIAPDEQIFQTTRCGSLVGNPCHVGEEFPGALMCVENAVCDPFANSSDPGIGTCRCEKNIIPSIDGTCGNTAGGLPSFSITVITVFLLSAKLL